MFDMYAQCLEHLKMDEEFVRLGLKVISRSAELRRARAFPDALREEYLSRVIFTSTNLRKNVEVPLDQCFGDVSLSRYIKHENLKDSFYLRMDVDYLLLEGFKADEVRCKLLCEDFNADTELWLSAQNFHFEPQSRATIYLKSHKMMPGWFVIDQIEIAAEQVVFVHKVSKGTGSILTPQRSNVEASSAAQELHRILVWSQPRALDVQLSKSKVISLDQRKSLLMRICSGWNDVSRGTLTVRAGSAGLRLHTADADFDGPSSPKASVTEPGLIRFETLSPDTTLKARVPYTLENDVSEITVKIEAAFTTDQGNFTFTFTRKINIALPLGINVQDNFQEDWLISKFSMGPAMGIPVRITSCKVDGTDAFSVLSLPLRSDADISRGRPASFMCKVKRKQGTTGASMGDHSQRTLRLHIGYACLDAEIEASLKSRLNSSIASSPFLKMSRLLLQPIVHTILGGMSEQDMETVAILREFRIPSLHEGALAHVIDGLPHKCRGPLLKWLHHWQEVGSSVLFAC